MKKTINITKGTDTSKLTVIAELLKDLPKELFEEVDRNDGLSQFFGNKKIVAAKSFNISVELEVLKG